MTETKKYVRIKKASVDGVWYADKIGQIFEVVHENSVAILTKCGGHHSVLREDAELIVTEKRPAKVGERVLITVAAPIGEQSYETGDVFVAESLYDPFTKDIQVLGMPDFIDYNEYEVIVNSEVKNEEADGMESVNLTAIDTASTVFEKVGEDYIGSKSRFGDILIGAPYSEAFVKAYANERKDVLVIPQTIEYTAFLHNEEMKKVATHGQAPIVSAQARRDEIVEQAKADVAKLIEDAGSSVRVGYGNFTLRHRMSRVEFVVNREKRTVVALVFGKIPRFRNELREKGIAKAAPDDCFNAHIGKAIALRRALGLAVPDEYLNAPQPTEIRVGDVVCGNRGDDHYYSKNKTFTITSDSVERITDGFLYKENTDDWIEREQIGRIIDDSREEVGS
ncbi:hypothetical protein [Bacillus velezensis]|uniref:hypothetical protein n=1 Tax=Bacillus velezensis TaxID=492670 RepID=UPI001CFA720A|nr:hypothetical protein [Bacillus velezensis]GJI62596.1 hypothetical protein BVSY1_17520 [Bacillus velezensis]